MKVEFKYSRLVRQWAVLLIKNPKLVYIVLYAAVLLGGKVTITHIKRTRKEQAEIYPDQPEKPTVHFFDRGVDIRTRGYSMAKILKVQKEINYKFPYGKEGVETAVVHNVGQGMHMHLQTRGTG